MKKIVTYALALAIASASCNLQNALAQTAPAAARYPMVEAPVKVDNAPAVPAHASPYNFPGTQYPRIEADNRVTFRLNAPTATKVQVSIANIPYDMVKADNGTWTYTSEPQTPGYHNYWMIVDGATLLDPGTNTFVGYSHLCNAFEIPEPGVTFYDIKDVPHGNVLIKNCLAKTTNSWRRLYMYTPPGYDKDASTKYPVLYLMHGGGEDERVWIDMGRANVILDNLIADGKAKPMIVVMDTTAVSMPGGRGMGGGGMPGGAPGTGAPRGMGPTAGPNAATIPAAARGAGAGPGAGGGGGGGRGMGGGMSGPLMGVAPGGGAFGTLMTNDLIPWVEANFRTLSDRDHRAMAGLSMGGYYTSAVTMANLDKFSYIGLFSGGSEAGFASGGRGGPVAIAPTPIPTSIDIKTVYQGAMANPDEFNKKVKVLFFSFGTVLPLENPEGLKRHQELLQAAGIKNSYMYISPDTSHEWQTWRRSLYTFAPLLFRD